MRSPNLTASQRNAGWIKGEEAGFASGQAVLQINDKSHWSVSRFCGKWCRSLITNRTGSGYEDFNTLAAALEGNQA